MSFKLLPIVQLWGLTGDWVGLVIPCSSGVYYSNQTHGVVCNHPEVEGIYIPLPAQNVNNTIIDMGTLSELDIKNFLKANSLFEVFGPAKRRKGSGEAWVPVKVKQGLSASKKLWTVSLMAFQGRVGWLTYSNSD
jgi:hypothetical protein